MAEFLLFELMKGCGEFRHSRAVNFLDVDPFGLRKKDHVNYSLFVFDRLYLEAFLRVKLERVDFLIEFP